MSRSLSPCSAEVQVERLIAEADHITLLVRVFRPVAACPGCARPSYRIHSYYERRLADLPWNGIPVEIRVRTRRFFCDTEDCARHIFTERLPETTETYARSTLRMEQALRWLALALGGEAGARTAQRLGLGVSGDTLLRHLRRVPLARKPAPIAPRVLGMDDWAWRKGQRDGTILCDLERRCVVDLLPDRQANTVAKWLRDHAPPGVISRDRAGACAEAARQGAPHAVQVADRFHLLRNLREAVEHVLTRHGSIIEEAIASQSGLNRKTVRHWLRAEQFPERQVRRRYSSVDRWLSYLEQRWAEGCHNRSQLWRELRTQGADFAAVTF